MQVRIVQTGADTVSVTEEDGLQPGATVANALALKNISSAGYTIAVDGEPSAMSRVLQDGNIIQLIGKVKGGGDIEVSLVKFGEDTQKIEVPEGSTVKDVLAKAGYGTQGFTISVNGSPGTVDTPVHDTYIIQLVPKVKGGLVDRFMHQCRVFKARWF